MKRLLQNVLFIPLVASLSFAFVAPAMAQDDESEVEGGEVEDPDTAAEADADTPVEAKAAVAADDDAPFSRVSDDEETIYAVQRKAFLVKGKFELSPLLSASFSDRFVQTFAPAASVTYHLGETFGLELYGAYFFPSESALTKDILNNFSLRSDTAKLTQMLWTVGFGVQWSPIYGKVNVFGSTLGNFAFYLGLGVGLGQTRVQCDAGMALDPNRGFNPPTCPLIPVDADATTVVYEPATLRPMGALSGGVRFNFSSRFALKFEVKNYLFAARVYRPDVNENDKLADAIRTNVYAQVGVSFLFGGEDD